MRLLVALSVFFGLPAILATIIVAAFAQDANERARAAIPALAQQRNNAMDAEALCQGDVALLKQQLAEAKAEIDKLKAPPAK